MTEKYGIIHLTRSEAFIGIVELDGGITRSVTGQRKESMVPAVHMEIAPESRKKRFERLVEVAIHEWFENIATAFRAAFDGRELDAVIVSGSAAERFVTKYY